jgi:hypothetical protein
MPESLGIGAFVFGAILILAALAGGQVKLFGAEVSAKLDHGVRAVAFVLGLGLLGWALLRGEGGAPPAPAVEPRGSTAATLAPAGDAAADLPALAGEWVDNHGGLHRISQQGARLSFVGYNDQAGVSSQGSGRIEGDRIVWEYETDIPSTGTVRLRLAPDHNSASGVVQDSAEGRYSIVLTRD